MASKTKTKQKTQSRFSLGKQKLLSVLRRKSFTAVLECFWILYRAAPMKLKMRVNVKLEKAGSKPTTKRKAPKKRTAKRKAPKKKSTGKKKGRTAKQRAATRKLVALNKKKSSKRKKR